MSEAEKDHFYQQIYDALHTPVEAMSQGRPHNRARSAALDALLLHFKATGRTIYLADELAVIYPGERTFEPDLLAVLDVPQPHPDEDERMAWVVADEGKGPDLILEVLHKGNRDKDLGRNVVDYARLGVREYFVYDRLNHKLCGYRLGKGGTYGQLRPRLGRLSSEVLGLDLALVERRLRFFSGMGELMNSDEFIERLSRMMDGIEARAEEAEAQAEQAQAQAEQAQAQAEQAQAQLLLEARQAVLDLAEAYGLEVSPSRRQQVEAAALEELRALRAALKQHRSWPERTT
jgi:Uma2 family endonuclease